MSKTLESLIKNLADTLENQPDVWFNDPCGWLYKPNFKREAQERASVIEHSTQQSKPFSWKRMMTGSPYKKRWFRLDVKKRILRYYKNSDESEQIGDLDMGTIVDVTFSKLYDAPEFAVDLMTIQKHYTLAAESHAMMVKWAYAFRIAMQARPGHSKRDTAIVSALSKFQTNPNEKWLRYDFTYQDPGPLYLNVMGTCHRDRIGKVLKNSIVVISFEPDKDGMPGRSEKSGLISVGDFLVGYNGIDLTEYTFNDAVDIIISAAFPKTLNFMRDTEKVRVCNRKEGWAFVYYPALTKYRRRYVEIRDDLIHFHKPAPGGSALSERDAFFDLAWVGRLKPVNDLTMPKDQQYILRLECQENSVIEHVNDEDQAIGTTKVRFLDLCFPKESTLNAWRSILVSPSTTNVASTIQVDPLEVIQATESSPKSKIAIVGFKSTITNKFSPREFRLTEGTLRWKRLPSKRVVIGGSKEQSLFLANSHGCDVRTVKAVEDLSIPKGQGYRYQLHITAVDINYETGISSQSSITMGMEDDRTALAWLQLIRDCVSVSPPDMLSLVSISTAIQATNDPTSAPPPSSTNTGDEDNDDLVDVFATNKDDASSHHDDENEILQSYLYKRLDRPGAGGSKPEYVKRWFVLKDHHITFYKSAAESRGQAFILGTINVHQALSVCEGGDGSPDNTFEIIMPTKTHIFVAEDEYDMNQWIDAIGDILEAREQVVAEDDGDGRGGAGENGKSTRMMKLQDASLYSGELQMKRFNRLTQKFVWRDRFIVIAAGSVYYYEHQEDFYDENKTCAGEIPVVAIVKVETHTEPKVKAGCGFSIQARVVEGGDHEGIRSYIFEARLPELATQWMEQICAATGEMRVENKHDGPGYESVRIESATRHIEKRRSLMAGSVRVDALRTEDSLTPEGSPALAKRSPLERRVSAGPGGRGGRGFSRTGSIVVAHDSSPTNEAVLSLSRTDTDESLDEDSILPDSSPLLSTESRRASSRRVSDGLGGNALAGRGRGSLMANGILTPKTAFRRQSEIRRTEGESRRSTSPVPNESF